MRFTMRCTLDKYYYIEYLLYEQSSVWYFLSDKSICRELNLDIYEYANIMKNVYHGEDFYDGFKFKNKEDAKGAKEWLESILLIRELAGVK